MGVTLCFPFPVRQHCTLFLKTAIPSDNWCSNSDDFSYACSNALWLFCYPSDDYSQLKAACCTKQIWIMCYCYTNMKTASLSFAVSPYIDVIFKSRVQGVCLLSRQLLSSASFILTGRTGCWLSCPLYRNMAKSCVIIGWNFVNLMPQETKLHQGKGGKMAVLNTLSSS